MKLKVDTGQVTTAGWRRGGQQGLLWGGGGRAAKAAVGWRRGGQLASCV